MLVVGRPARNRAVTLLFVGSAERQHIGALGLSRITTATRSRSWSPSAMLRSSSSLDTSSARAQPRLSCLRWRGASHRFDSALRGFLHLPPLFCGEALGFLTSMRAGLRATLAVQGLAVLVDHFVAGFLRGDHVGGVERDGSIGLRRPAACLRNPPAARPAMATPRSFVPASFHSPRDESQRAPLQTPRSTAAAHGR